MVTLIYRLILVTKWPNIVSITILLKSFNKLLSDNILPKTNAASFQSVIEVTTLFNLSLAKSLAENSLKSVTFSPVPRK